MKRLSLLLALLALGSCRRGRSEASEPTPPPDEAWLTPAQVAGAHLAIAKAGLEDVGGEVVASGRVTFDDLHVTHVFSPVTGRVVKIEAALGERVKRGAPLCTIDSPDVGSAFADLAKAQADLTAARHDLARQTLLYQEHAGSQRDDETAEDAFARARAEYERARKKAELLRGGGSAVTQGYTLRAPIDGQVIARNVNPGAEVQGQYAGGNAVELFTIGDLDSVWVVADVFEMDLAKVHAGARATVKVVAYPGRLFDGVVDWVSGTLDPATRTAKVRCRIANPEHLLMPEMYATMSISVAERQALAIPRSAMLRLGDQTVVFVESGAAPGGRRSFERRPIAVDEDEGGDWLPVTHGLEAGDRIVVQGGALLSGML